MKVLKSFLIMAFLASAGVRADTEAVHGMLLFGDKLTYASHLPMFHAPHDYQVILKLDLLDHPHSDTLQAYQDAKLKGSSLFTLVPEPMVLTKIIDGSKTSFNGSIYEGHFERGGKEIGEVTVKVSQLVLGAKLNGDQDPGNAEEYIIFGESGEYFSAHIIRNMPSFDVVMKVKQPMRLEHPLCRHRVCPDPVSVPVTDSQLPLMVSSPLTQPNIGDVLGSPFFGVHTTVEKTLYYEENELSR